MAQAIIFRLSDTVGKEILAFVPETSHAQVSKAFAAWTKKAMEQEWRALGSNPLLARQVAAIQAEPPHCFKRLLNEQSEAFLTSTTYDAFVAAQPAFAGFYGRARFEKGAALLVEDAQEQDRNLERAWNAGGIINGMAWQLGFLPLAPGVPQTADQIRAYLDNPANQAAINGVFGLNLSDLELTGIPPEVVKFPMVNALGLSNHRIRNIPKEILNLRNLHSLLLDGNLFDCIPEILMRYNGFTLLSQNPIQVFSEEMYDHCFAIENWLGSRFSDRQFILDGFGYLFSCFQFAPYSYKNSYIWLSQDNLQEIPFALWLREKLVISNLMSLFEDVGRDLNWMPDFLNGTIIFTCVGISLILAPFLWVLNQFLSLAVVPIVTKVRELLGYGRMMRLD